MVFALSFKNDLEFLGSSSEKFNPKKEINLVRDVRRKRRVLLPIFKLKNCFIPDLQGFNQNWVIKGI